MTTTLANLRWGGGLLLWVLFFLIPDRWLYLPTNRIFIQLFLLAPAFLVHFGLYHFVQAAHRRGTDSLLYTLILRWDWVGMWLCFSAFSFEPGWISGGLATGWLVVTLAIGLLGMHQLLWRGVELPEEFCLNMGLVFIPVGGIWLVASRLGIPLMGFDPTIVFLTAIHFHYAGFASCVIVGASGRLLYYTYPQIAGYRWIVAGVILGIPLLALGISFSPVLEVGAALVFILSMLGWALLILRKLSPQIKLPVAKFLLLVSCFSIIWSLAWACLYALGEFNQTIWVTIPKMGWVHGLVNVLGFACCGFWALAWLRPESRGTLEGIPLSQLRSRGFVGPAFFQRIKAVPDTLKAPRGLVDTMEVYQRPDFQLSHLDPQVRQFYENTQRFALRVTPDWQPGFRWGGKLFRFVTDRLGQMALPILVEKREDDIASQILPVDDTRDGRAGVRAWVRTYRDTGKAVYVAAYSYHHYAEHGYMNIAFPLPFSNLTSILRLDLAPVSGFDKQGICLTSKAVNEHYGDQGVYLVTPWQPIRLPINETIWVWNAETQADWPVPVAEDVEVLARHEMWFFGLHCLTLYYALYPTPSP